MATIEFTAFPRATEGRGASRRMRRAGKAPGIVYGGTAAAADRARPQRADPCAAQRSVPCVDPDDEARRRERRRCCCATCRCIRSATRCCTSTSSAIDENRKIHMKVPLHFVNAEQSPAVKMRRRDHQPRDDGDRHRVPAEGPAGVHRGRPVRARRRPFAARVGVKLPAGRDGRVARQGRSGRRDRRRAEGRRSRPRKPPRRRSRRPRLRQPRCRRRSPRGRRRAPTRVATRRKRRQGRQEEVTQLPARRPAVPRAFSLPARRRLTFAHAHARSGSSRASAIPAADTRGTRHNAGFWFADALAAKLGATLRARGASFAGDVAKAGDVRDLSSR